MTAAAPNIDAAIALHRSGRIQDAEQVYRSILARDQDDPVALHFFGLLQHQTGDSDAALGLIRKAIGLRPDYAAALTNLGVVLSASGKHKEAVEAFEKASQLSPDVPDAHFNFGNTLYQLEAHQRALACFERTLTLDSGHVGAMVNKGSTLRALGRFAEAEDILRQAIARAPADTVAKVGLANVVRDRDRPQEAEGLYREVLARDGKDAEALCNLGIALRDQGRVVDAIETFRSLVRLHPDHANGHLNLALTLLLAGRFAEGWQEYEWREKVRQMRPAGATGTVWDGKPMAGTLLVYAEQGLGDTVQFARFLADARARVGRLVLMCHAPLRSALARVSGVDAAIGFNDAPPANDRVTSLLSLPHLLSINVESRAQAYMTPLSERVEIWRERLAAAKGFKVGLVWAGRRTHPLDYRRSLSAQQMNLLPRIPGVTYVTLQQGEGAQEADKIALPLLDLGPEIKDIEDSLALASLVDLVITADTAMAHLAGALGRPTFVMLPAAPDWRWQLDRDSSPWYPATKLFRQARPSVWIEPLLKAGAALVQRVAKTESGMTGIGLQQQAVTFHQAKKLPEAERAVWQGLALEPDSARSLLMLGALRVAGGDHSASIAILSHGMLIGGPDPEALANLGVALRGEDRDDEAERAYRRAMEIAPRFAPALYNLGNLINGRGAWAEAEALYRRALEITPNNIDAIYNLGNAVRDLGRLDEAIALYRRALELKPDYHAVRNSLGMALILSGDFVRGWEAYEARWLGDMISRGFSQPKWDGTRNGRKVLLLHAEQGIGDTIQFLRYVPAATERFGGRIVLEVQAPLVNMARHLMPEATIVAQNDPLPRFDCYLPLMSLPHVFGTSIDTVPAEIPYLTPLPTKVKRWRKELGKGEALKVGVVWAGNPKHKNDHRRSMPFSAFEVLPAGPGIRYLSLQYGDRRTDLAGAKLPLEDLGARIEDFDDTAAIVSCLDLIVTCDTAMAHLAGALGVPAWVLLPYAPDWRWVLSRDDTPWYPSVRLFRQWRSEDWSGPMAAINEALAPIAQGQTGTTILNRAKEELRAGRAAEARALADTVLGLAPGRKEALKLAVGNEGGDLALIHADVRLGRLATAERVAQRLLRARPESGDGLAALAEIRKAQGRKDEALDLLKRAIELDADCVSAREQLAELALTEKKLVEAKDHLKRIAARTSNLTSLDRLVELCANAPLEALAALERLSAVRPNDAKIWHKYGQALYYADRHDDAEAALRRALDLAPGMQEARSDLGAVLTRKGDIEPAIDLLKQTVAANPRYAAAFGNLGVAYRKAGRADEAVAALDTALAIQPDYHDYHWNRSLSLLHAGRFEEGWREFEWRWKVPGFPSPVRGFKEPLWGGEPLNGRTILIYAEQGLGDAFQFLRYVPMVVARGGRVVLEVPSNLVELCRCLVGVAQIVAAGQSLPKFELQAPLLSLPLAFGTKLETIPLDVPYLMADPLRAAQWKARRDSRVAVGFIWAGRKKPDPKRTIGLATLKPLLDIPGIKFVALQKELEPGDEALLAELKGKIEYWGGDFQSFADTAAAMTALDLIVSIDTSSCHLAGALGRPTWVMLPRAVDWRWMTGRDDNPWYPSMRVFRQAPAGGWPPVIEAVAQALRAFERPVAESAPMNANTDVQALFKQGAEALARGRLDDAQAALQQVLAADQNHSDALHHLGLVELRRHRTAEARALIQRALAINDADDAAWANLGVVQREAGDTAAAIECYNRALALNPNHAGAYYNLGNIRASRGGDEEAIICFRRAAEIMPGHANALNNLGLALQRRGDLDQAVVMLTRAADVDSRGTDALANLALALQAQKKSAEALAASTRAVAARPNSALAHRVHALSLKGEGNLDGAIEALSRALYLEPNSAEAYNLLGNTLRGVGRVRDAEAAFGKALALEPGRGDALFNRGTLQLLVGDFKQGWDGYEYRWQARGIPRRTFPQPEWDGSPLAGRTILVHAEQGLGDTIQFARYLPKLAEAGGKVVAEVQAELVELVRGMPGVTQVVVAGQPLPSFALHVPMLSLPRLLKTTMATIPAEVPYLRVPAEHNMAGLPDLSHAPGLRVGLIWAGNPDHGNDRWRSMALAELKPVLETVGVTFVSLQVGVAAGELADSEAAIVDAAPALKSFTDTAALMDELDLIIAVDTASAHCAGALGRPVWTMLAVGPDWRWLLQTPRSPWYPTMRLYRQEKLGDWAPVVTQVAADLAREVAAKRAGATAQAAATPVTTIEPQATRNRKPVIFKWGMSSYFGWGVYGVNLMLSWAEDKNLVPVCAIPFNADNIAMDAMRRRRMEPQFKASMNLINGLAAHRGGAVTSSSLVLHGLGNNMTPVASAHEVDLNGKSNLGVFFIEDSVIDPAAAEKSKRFELLIAGSTWNKELMEANGITVPTKVILQGVDQTLFHPAPKSGLFKDRFVVFSGGKLEHRKGQDLALLAFRAFAERHPEALMVTAWHSPWPDLARAMTANSRVAPVPFSGGKADLAGWAVANGIPAEQFQDLGQVPNPQMPTILRECDVGIFTNRGEGGTNLVAMETMACGVPCILSANTGHLDLIRDGTCVPLKKQGKVKQVGSFRTDGWGESDVDEAVEALEALWRDRKRAEDIGRTGAALLAQMSWPDQMRRLKDLILPYVP